MARDYPGIIDIHTHIGRLPGVVGEAFTPEDLLYIQAHEGADLQLVSSASTTTVSQACGMEEMNAMLAQHGSRLKGMVWINPHDPTWQTQVSQLASPDIVGIKIHPVLDHYTVSQTALEDVFQLARSKNWPILTHTDSDGTSMSAGKYEALISAYSDVVLILAHLRLEAIPLARRYDNVFLDTTYVDAMMVEVGVSAVGVEKILFGSDAAEGFDVGHPVARDRPLRSYAALVGALRTRGIGDTALEMMLHRNARVLFGLH